MNKNNHQYGVEVFCRYIRRNGRIIYPKNRKYFHFWINK